MSLYREDCVGCDGSAVCNHDCDSRHEYWRTCLSMREVDAVKDTPVGSVVYFIQNRTTLAIKIGFSATVTNRLSQLRNASADSLELVHWHNRVFAGTLYHLVVPARRN